VHKITDDITLSDTSGSARPARACHEEIARTYSRTGMARGFSPVRPDVLAVASVAQEFGQGQRFGSGATGLLDQLISGWRINAIAMYQSGPPFTIPCNIATTTGQGCNAVLTGEPLYPDNRSFERWLNPSAFTNPPVATTIGQTDLSPLGGPPTQVRGPDFKRIDVSVFKGFRGVGRQRFEVRAEIFNLTNTQNFSVPGFSGGGAGLPPPPGVLDFSNTANFGRITALRLGANDQRQIQLALKYYF
jgi:hypothetical protein